MEDFFTIPKSISVGFLKKLFVDFVGSSEQIFNSFSAINISCYCKKLLIDFNSVA